MLDRAVPPSFIESIRIIVSATFLRRESSAALCVSIRRGRGMAWWCRHGPRYRIPLSKVGRGISGFGPLLLASPRGRGMRTPPSGWRTGVFSRIWIVRQHPTSGQWTRDNGVMRTLGTVILYSGISRFGVTASCAPPRSEFRSSDKWFERGSVGTSARMFLVASRHSRLKPCPSGNSRKSPRGPSDPASPSIVP